MCIHAAKPDSHERWCYCATSSTLTKSVRVIAGRDYQSVTEMSSLVHPCRSLYECLSSDSQTAGCTDCRMPGNVDRGLAICWPVPEIATLKAYSRTLQIYSHCRQVVMSAVSMI